jgi:hypothetical protein
MVWEKGKKVGDAGYWWLTSVILTTQETEDHGSKPAWTNSSGDPISKIPNTKKGWWNGSSGRALEVLSLNPKKVGGSGTFNSWIFI